MVVSKKEIEKLTSQEYAQKVATNNFYNNRLALVRSDEGFKDFSNLGLYLHGQGSYIDRNLITAHYNFEPITKSIAQAVPFNVITGIDLSESLNLGHLSYLNILRDLHNLGASILIPFNDLNNALTGKIASPHDQLGLIHVITKMKFDLKRVHVVPYSQFPENMEKMYGIIDLLSDPQLEYMLPDWREEPIGTIIKRTFMPIASWLVQQEKHPKVPPVIASTINTYEQFKMYKYISRKFHVPTASGIVTIPLPSLKDPLRSRSLSR